MDKVEFLKDVEVHDGFVFEKGRQYKVVEDNSNTYYFVFTGKENEVTQFKKDDCLDSVFIDVVESWR